MLYTFLATLVKLLIDWMMFTVLFLDLCSYAIQFSTFCSFFFSRLYFSFDYTNFNLFFLVSDLYFNLYSCSFMSFLKFKFLVFRMRMLMENILYSQFLSLSELQEAVVIWMLAMKMRKKKKLTMKTPGPAMAAFHPNLLPPPTSARTRGREMTMVILRTRT